MLKKMDLHGLKFWYGWFNGLFVRSLNSLF
jgi:hypothetical protein